MFVQLMQHHQHVCSEPLNKMTETPPVKLCVHTLDLHHGCTASYQGRSIMQHSAAYEVFKRTCQCGMHLQVLIYSAWLTAVLFDCQGCAPLMIPTCHIWLQNANSWPQQLSSALHPLAKELGLDSCTTQPCHKWLSGLIMEIQSSKHAWHKLLSWVRQQTRKEMWAWMTWSTAVHVPVHEADHLARGDLNCVTSTDEPFACAGM